MTVTALSLEQASVGVRVEIDHVAPAHIGEVADAHPTPEGIEGHRLSFVVTARVENRVIATGRMLRLVTDR
ncbi:MAG: hotdog domain-containing protein [Acidimicrobiales bacterium]